ncbi:Oidioi.mRNA.OKI2018_I69.chr1.g2613.t1.cds [Oikopleura dioica]|uniref:Oidioi.mRNA.OKI2018_I69.chr1.g2613.t1.cds n=1 Tax=Oikopleura dioica TaxID=34765 RepID=A0ABN7STD1_OIKDI|nr:Oidioi.mRNA.OKI2018_I69.chr1.g2613.t1.cds [Oikopleura dioica]
MRTGIFTAPVTGTYFFSASARGKDKRTVLHLRQNTKMMVSGKNNANKFSTLSCSAVLFLQKRDTVDLLLRHGEILGYTDSDGHTTQFSGFLISQED